MASKLYNCKKIGHAPALNALNHTAQSLGQEGLEFWEELTSQIEQEEN